MESQAEAVRLGQRRSERTALVASLRDRRGALERDLAQRRSDAREMEGLVRQLASAERQRASEAAAARAAAAATAAREAESARQAEVQRQADLASRRAAERAEVRRRPTPRADAPPRVDTPAPTASAPIARAEPRRAEPSPAPPRRADAVAPARRLEPSDMPVRRVDEAPRPAARSESRPEPRPAPRVETPRETAPAPRDEAPRPAPAARPAAPAATPASREESLSGSFTGNRGRLPWPADGTVVGAFGPRRDPVYGTTITSIGIDIATASGAPARAVFEGTVERVGSMASFGTYVMVSHGTFTTVYGNLSAVTVAQGAHVRAGQAVGRAGTASDRRGTQLFFALFQDGRPVNPTGWLR
jgi:septal ring factor EnvC (AmiA/AmiB activator)